jgi:hypothetical protein
VTGLRRVWSAGSDGVLSVYVELRALCPEMTSESYGGQKVRVASSELALEARNGEDLSSGSPLGSLWQGQEG